MRIKLLIIRNTLAGEKFAFQFSKKGWNFGGRMINDVRKMVKSMEYMSDYRIVYICGLLQAPIWSR